MTDAKAVDIARAFHEAYERLAPQFGYETRPETREFDPDSPNGRLMVAVCAETVTALLAEVERAQGEAARCAVQFVLERDKRIEAESALAAMRVRCEALVAEWTEPTPQDECTLYTMGQRSGRNKAADELRRLLDGEGA